MTSTTAAKKNGNGTKAPEAVVINTQAAQGEISELEALKAELQAEKAKSAALEAAKAKNPGGFGEVSCVIKQVEPKKPVKGKEAPKEGEVQGGTVGIYGLGVYPLTMYGDKVPQVFDPDFVLKVMETVIEKGHLLRLEGKKGERNEAEVKALRAAIIADAKTITALLAPLKGKFKSAVKALKAASKDKG